MKAKSCAFCTKKRRCFEAFKRGTCSDYKKRGGKKYAKCRKNGTGFLSA